MSATVASRPPSHMNNRVHDQTNPHSPPRSSLSPLQVPLETTMSHVQQITEERDALNLPLVDAMDHEATQNQVDLPLPSNADSPTLPPFTNPLQSDQMNVDSYLTASWNGSFTSQPQPSVVGPTIPPLTDSTTPPGTFQVASRPTLAPVSLSARGNQSRRRMADTHSLALRPEDSHRAPAPTEPAENNAHSEDESSIEDEEEDEEFDSDRKFLESMVEDLSIPTKDALEKIEHSKEISALDHSIWESRVYKALDDPEYRPQAAGKIAWTLKGFHGTLDAPNKKRILRSPPMNIGGFRFNIKVFPKGNDGTDHVSVYIECTGPSNSANTTSAESDSQEKPSNQKDTSEAGSDAATSSPKWEVPAQIGCIMYNPQDPRVYAFEHATHHFQDDSPDWGWVRFYGPWSTLHVRRWEQRRPMLQNDELAFCVYVRTIEDPTRSLWWQPTNGCQWNSFTKTGLRAIEGKSPCHRAVVAALVPWLHLSPFKKLLTSSSIPRSHLQSERRPWPMFEALHGLLQQKSLEATSEDVANVAMVEKLLKWYEADPTTEFYDVVEIWENLRSILNREYYGDPGDFSHRDDILSFIKTYKVNYEPPIPSEKTTLLPQKHTSAQEIVNDLITGAQNMHREWDGHMTTDKEFPAVLQLELCRQRYDAQQRIWKRLTHRVHINETITVKDTSYRLFGLVVSRGKLGSGKTYSIVRSSDIDSQWVAYKIGAVSLLTTQSAIRSHEGDTQTREGDESVAQVLIYIRSSCCANCLPTKPQIPHAPIMRPFSALEEPLRKTTEPLATLPVVVHFASAFKGYEGPGIVDPYRPVKDGVSGVELPSHFNAESTIESVEKYLHATRDGKRLFQCSVLDWEDPPAYQPPRPSKCSPADKLGQVCKRFSRVHLWARCAPLPQPSGASTAETEEMTTNDPTAVIVKELYVKVFRPSVQRLVGVTSFITTRDAKLWQHIPLGQLPPEPCDIYVENSDGQRARRTEMTLDTLISSPEIPSSCVLVIAPKPGGSNAVQTSVGNLLQELVEYFLRQKFCKHFAYQGSMHRKSYFGGVHFQCQLQDSLPSGHGTLVQTNGDYYTGSFRSGGMHGEGTMYYANGDTYCGSRCDDQRSGHGKMVYRSTGNIYIGEWREDRRHGSGTMTFKKADEEQLLCHICYSNEIDTLFYRCGHILACEACARQCTDCPVCRKRVDAIVKIYDMRREGV